MVEQREEGFHGARNIRVIVEPAGLWFRGALHGDLHLEAVPVHFPALMPLRREGECLRSFEIVVLGEPELHCVTVSLGNIQSAAAGTKRLLSGAA
jgi:hypothetical protein